MAKLRKTKTCLQVHKKLRHLVKPDESLKSGNRAMKRYIKLLDMDLPGGHCSYVPDASVALNPLLNTKNLSKLECFMRHGGLHVLYEMLRYFLPIFEDRPVLRKLLKALQHLHDRKMLGVEHMQCDAPRFCMLKFFKLLFDPSEHEDLEVRIIRARSFQGLDQILFPPEASIHHMRNAVGGSTAQDTEEFVTTLRETVQNESSNCTEAISRESGQAYSSRCRRSMPKHDDRLSILVNIILGLQSW